jgi:hypothetical protein
MKTNSQRPPIAPLWKMVDGKPIGCGVCEAALHQDRIAGVDVDLGPICRDCDPHVRSALHIMWIVSKRAA